MAKKSDINNIKPSIEKSRVEKPTRTKKTKATPSKKKNETLKSNKSKIVKTDEREGKEKKEKSKFIRKRFFMMILVIVIICILGFLWFALNPEVAKAQLIIESGVVQIKHEGGSWTSVQNGTLLYQSDTVKTGNDTSASIILFKSSIIRLDSNTEVMIQEIIQQTGETSVKIQQDIGRTWSTISKISGIDNYDVQTPTTIASVRGTTIDVNVTTEGNTTVSVINGSAIVSRTQNGTIVDTTEVNENQSVTVDPKLINQSLEIKPVEKDGWIQKNQQKDEEFRGNVKEELYRRIEPYIPKLKEQYGMTDEELDVLIDGYLKGYFDLPPDTPDWIREIIEYS
ncbi:MAG: FecR domain-containing protein [Thermoplasmata archaeon]|nr:MAG: FecR domain-containing protein [Thermoplasmata archaeon]